LPAHNCFAYLFALVDELFPATWREIGYLVAAHSDGHADNSDATVSIYVVTSVGTIAHRTSLLYSFIPRMQNRNLVSCAVNDKR
jgi:hypothetical protein